MIKVPLVQLKMFKFDEALVAYALHKNYPHNFTNVVER